MAPFGKGGGPQERGVYASIFMRSVAVTNCIFVRGAKVKNVSELGDLAGVNPDCCLALHAYWSEAIE